MAISRDTPFLNDPFVVVAEAYRRIWNKPYLAVWSQHSKDDQDSFGITQSADGCTPVITVFAEHTINEQIETFAHELAHVAVGVEHGHDKVFKKALKDLKAMYDIVYDEMLGENDGKDPEAFSEQFREARRRIECSNNKDT